MVFYVYNYKEKFEVKMKKTVFYDKCLYFASHTLIINKLCIKVNIDISLVLYPRIVKLICLLGEIFLFLLIEK